MYINVPKESPTKKSDNVHTFERREKSNPIMAMKTQRIWSYSKEGLPTGMMAFRELVKSGMEYRSVSNMKLHPVSPPRESKLSNNQNFL